MLQRLPNSWRSARGTHHRPRLLIEDSDPGMAVSDFSRFRQAGFEVGLCTGPGDSPGDCPLLRAARCDVLDGADVVLHRLPADSGVAGAMRRQGATGRVVAVGAFPEDAAGPAVLPESAPVEAQIRTLRRCLTGSGRSALPQPEVGRVV